ncbi:4304_t:CDS:2 [Paraglomus brasilianum]|uniref:4304_t:CDS:1 n=1 Tax=Paraglomus brasilianum TaxID=144538 RepID=A0A9N9CZX8_9GLOM|nr:4304_t:CDS:2 [Paraglomus brasilianum]
MSLYMQLTSLLLPVFSSFLILILLYVINFYVTYITRENPLPGPIPLPIAGNLHQMKNSSKFYAAMHKRYGDVFEFYIANKRFIMLNRVDLAEKVLTQSVKSNYFIRAASESQGWEELGLTKKGLIGNKERNSWLLNRRLLNHCLTSTKYIKEIVTVVQTLFSEAEEYWKELGDSTSLEFTEWIHCLNVDTQVRIVTSQRTYALSTYFNSLLAPHLKKSLPQSSIQSYSKFVSHILFFNQVGKYFYFISPFLRHYVPGFRQIAERMKRRIGWLTEEMKKIVNERKREIENMSEKEELKVDLLSLMLTINTEKDTNRIKSSEFERPLTEEEIVQLLIEVFSGGIDTITNAICFTIYYTCKYPAVKARLLSEIDATVSSKGHSLSYDSIVTLFPYTSAVMKEAARVLTVAPIVIQLASEDDEVAGYKWRAGTPIGVNYGIIHKHTAYWKDPETFRPERFLDECTDEIKPKTFLPFGGTFEVELCEPDKEIKYTYSMTNQCTELKVYLRARNNKE